MEKKHVFKVVTEVEGISAEDLKYDKSGCCPICGKWEFSTCLPHLMFGGCDEHETVWYEGYSTSAGDEPLDVYLDRALAIYEYYFIDDEARKKIEGKDEVVLDEVAYRLHEYPIEYSLLWDGFDVAIRFASEERLKRDGQNSYEAYQERKLKEYEECVAAGRVQYRDGYDREADKDGNLLPPKGTEKDIPRNSQPVHECFLF
jgi:hypothetical protein